jgi:hypothetical protein
MPSQMCQREQGPEQHRQARHPEVAALDCGISVVSAQAAPDRRPRLSGYRPVHQLVLAVETTTVRVEPEEVLIADARANLTPTQMVERKLLALLRDIGPGVSLQRTDGPADFGGAGTLLRPVCLAPQREQAAGLRTTLLALFDPNPESRLSWQAES